MALPVFGLAVFAVGVFPGNVTPWHGLAAILTFASGGVSAVLSSRVVTRPFSYLCLLLGGISLIVLASVFFYGLVVSGPSALEPLGSGGIERWWRTRSSCGFWPLVATSKARPAGRNPSPQYQRPIRQPRASSTISHLPRFRPS